MNPIIISASYKTDIPAFYGDWFMGRLRAGFCEMVNPYGRQLYRISLAREDVEGLVFWTKNLGPFLPHLPRVAELGFPFVVQYSVNGYPRAIEQSVIDAHQAVDHMRHVARSFGARVPVWRYDPILISSLTPFAHHKANFRCLAQALEGVTDEVVISFAHIYRKTERNLAAAADLAGYTWSDPPDEAKRELAAVLTEIARSHGMQLSVCSQSQYLVEGSIAARCIDADRLGSVAGHAITSKMQGNRPDCGCFQSKDIGEYDTCPHGCVYCYAVQNRPVASERFRKHDPVTARLGMD